MRITPECVQALRAQCTASFSVAGIKSLKRPLVSVRVSATCTTASALLGSEVYWPAFVYTNARIRAPGTAVFGAPAAPGSVTVPRYTTGSGSARDIRLAPAPVVLTATPGTTSQLKPDSASGRTETSKV